MNSTGRRTAMSPLALNFPTKCSGVPSSTFTARTSTRPRILRSTCSARYGRR
nr:MAG TPA: hypothetical protein [Caudoviricetes sp.]